SCTIAGPAPLDLDPRLGPLAGNGGFAPTMALGRGSAAVNAAGATCAGANYGDGVVDARGLARPQGAACDLGAYEVASGAPVASAAAPDPVRVGSVLTLTATASNPGSEPLTGVIVTVTLPPHGVFIPAPAGCVVATGAASSTVACAVGALAPGQSHA